LIELKAFETGVPMRPDAEELLARLGQSDFRYREFSDQFADMELWPIFEALLTDDRVIGKPMSRLAAHQHEHEMEQQRFSQRSEAPAMSFDTMFRSYERKRDAGTPRSDVRNFLKNLSSHNPDKQ
jgi:hypothetical protein